MCSSHGFYADPFKAVLRAWILFVIYVSCLYLFYAAVSGSCSLVITCLERDDFLAILCAVVSCVFVTFPSRSWSIMAFDCIDS